jgi:hypothetical protein
LDNKKNEILFKDERTHRFLPQQPHLILIPIPIANAILNANANKMDAIILNNVSTYLTAEVIAKSLYNSGMLTVKNITDFLNNSYSKTVMIQIEEWHDTEEAYHVIKNLRHTGESEIETNEITFNVSIAEKHEFKVVPEEMFLTPNPYAEELDAYLEELYESDEKEWLEEYEHDSLYDDLKRDESYLYLDLFNLISV